MIDTNRKIVVVAPETASRSALKNCIGLKLLDNSVYKLDEQLASGSVSDIFVLASASHLPEISDVVKLANETKKLRTFFVREDIPASWLPQMFQRANLRLFRNVLVHTNNDWGTPKRVMNAWRLGSENDLIAQVHMVDSNKLLVLSCALEEFEIHFDSFAVFKGSNSAQRSNFKLSSEGSYIHWPELDVHLDLDSFRYVTDPQWRQRVDTKRLIHNKKLGQAIAALRQSASLKQTDIAGLSDRELRRIENQGVHPSYNTLCRLAAAHHLSANDYLNELTKFM